jgi:hypothetical protein
MSEVKMEMIEFQSGRKITWEEYAKELGDVMTEYTATKEDLRHLAIALADEFIGSSREMECGVCLRDIDKLNYVENRLSRVLKHLPEMRAEVEARLKNGFEWNKANPVNEEVDAWFEKPLAERLRIIAWNKANPYPPAQRR